MTRAEAINQLSGAEVMLFNREFKPFQEAIIMAISALKEQDATDINVANKWVSVEERLPPFHTDLLVVSYGRVYVAGEMLTWEDGHSTVYIPFFNGWKSYTHWMLLPSPPKEE